MNESLFDNDVFKSKEEVLHIHEVAQWKKIMTTLETHRGYMIAIKFHDAGKVFQKNKKRLEEADYSVYEESNHFSVRYVGDK